MISFPRTYFDLLLVWHLLVKEPESYVRVAKVADLVDGSGVAVEVAGKSILLCRTRGRVFAVSNQCSHAGEKLERGCVRNGWVSCPLHGARFDLQTGRAMNPPAVRPIATYPTRISDEWIEVGVHPAA